MTGNTFWRVLRPAIAGVGILLSLAAVFATAIGLDTNTAWGPSRWLLLSVGLALAVLPFVGGIGRWLTVILRRPLRRLQQSPISLGLSSVVAAVTGRAALILERPARALRSLCERVAQVPGISYALSTPKRRAITAAAFILLLAAGFDVWLLTTGYWNRWPSTTSHFALLAEGFFRGQLHLPLEPSPQLVASPDPYSMQAREFMPPVWDVSYYQERFYLYWGPVPSLLLTIPTALFGRAIGDWTLVLALTLGTAAVGTLLILRLWKGSGLSLPWWSVVPGAALMAFANPLPWLLSRPSVYEAAIVCGQFFFLLGLLAALPVFLEGRLSARNMGAAAIAWSLAVGSRVTLAPAAATLSLALLLILWWRRSASGGKAWRSMLALIVPLLAAVVLLGLYNWARFGDVIEFGHRYQLGRWDKFDQYETVVAIKNLIPNVYNYFLNSPHFLSVFPFVKPAWGAYYIWPAHYYAPPNYHTERITGVLLAVPYVWLGALGVYFGVRKAMAAGWRPGGAQSRVEWVRGISGLSVLTAAVVILLFAPIALFVSASMRHMADFAPALILLATLGFWQGYSALASRGARRRGFVFIVFVLTAVSIALGVLLAMTGFEGRFERLNPQLFGQLSRWLTP